MWRRPSIGTLAVCACFGITFALSVVLLIFSLLGIHKSVIDGTCEFVVTIYYVCSLFLSSVGIDFSSANTGRDGSLYVDHGVIFDMLHSVCHYWGSTVGKAD